MQNTKHEIQKRLGVFSLFFCILSSVFCVSASAEDSTPPASDVATSTAPAVSSDAEEPAEPQYAFNPGTRDPFLPLAGGGMELPDVRTTPDKEPGAFNPAAMELKGILRMPTGRWAVLAAPGGETYIVENGKVRDTKKKVVQGYVGFVKEKTLVLIGPNNQVTELKLKRDRDQEESKKAK